MLFRPLLAPTSPKIKTYHLSPRDPYPHDYHPYVDSNKAFNSVPREALKAALNRHNFPSWHVTSIDLPFEHPAVNGCTAQACRLSRGLRQGCPRPPSPFNLHLNLALFSLPQVHCKGNRPDKLESFACIDDLLFRLRSKTDAEPVSIFFDTTAQEIGRGD